MWLMDTIDHFNLRSFDLNLLVAFDALMEEGNVTRAAKRLKIQQPAMSHNLSTLRVLFQDELFIRVGQAMRPTARANKLAGPIRNALNQAQAALSAGDVFDPATENRVFRIGMSSAVDLLLLPDLTARLRQVAPGIRLLSPSYHEDRLDALLDAGVLDMAVGCKYSPASRQLIEVLYDAEVMCCYNPALLQLANPVPLEAYEQADHAVISHSDSLKGCLEGALDFAGADLNVVAAAPDFMSVLMTARASPVIATVPARIARRYASMLGLAMSPVPIELKFPPVAMVWPRHAENDSASLWLRDQIRDIFAAAPDDWRAMVQVAA